MSKPKTFYSWPPEKQEAWRAKRRAASARWKAKYPEKVLAYSRAFHTKSYKKVLEQRRKLRTVNPEKKREQQRKSYAANLYRRREKKRKIYAANVEQGRERVRKWQAANPEKVAVYRKRTRSLEEACHVLRMLAAGSELKAALENNNLPQDV